MSEELPIAELVLRYLNKEGLDEAQSERLKLWLSDADNRQELETKFRDPDWLAQNLRVMSHVDEIDHWRKFLERLGEHGVSLVNPEEQSPAPVRRIGVWKWVVAAAAIAAIVGGYRMFNRPPSSDQPVVAQKPMPD